MRRIGKASTRKAKKPGEMNSLEKAYAKVLEERRLVGEVVEWFYEKVTLVLANRTRFTPDFLVRLANDELEFHETKGFMRDDAAVKLKVAADQFPFRFYLIYRIPKKKGGGWDIREV